MALEDAFGYLSIINPYFSNLGDVGFVYDVALPLVSLFFAFYFLLTRFIAFGGRSFLGRGPSAGLAAIFSFISVFLFTLGYFGFWIGVFGILAFGVRGIVWRIVGLLAVGSQLTIFAGFSSQSIFISALSALGIVGLLVKTESSGHKTLWRVLGLIAIFAFYYFGTTMQITLPEGVLGPDWRELLNFQ
jgi:hypothetical protein